MNVVQYCMNVVLHYYHFYYVENFSEFHESLLISLVEVSHVKLIFQQILFFIASFNQGGLNKKEIKLNICNIFSILIFNELRLFV